MKTKKTIYFILGGLCLTLSAFAAAPVITDSPEAQIIFIGDSVTFEVTASGTAPLSYQWLRDGVEMNGEDSDTLTFITTAGDDGALFSVEVSNGDGSVASDSASLTIDFGMAGASHTTRLIEISTPWKYEVSKTDLGTSWRTVAYSDSAWASGGGLLYVEDSALPAAKTTALPLTPRSLPKTCYFRTDFTASIPSNPYSVSLEANAVVDDGFMIHLNGTEVLRLGLPEGSVTYETDASRTVREAAFEGPFELDCAGLVDGNNLLAVEVHQKGDTSSDIVMGLILDMVWSERLRDTVAPVVAELDPVAGTTVTSLSEITVTFSEAVFGVDAGDLLINGVAAESVLELSSTTYTFSFPSPPEDAVSVVWAAGHGIIDRSSSGFAFTGAGFNYLRAPLDSENLALNKRSYMLRVLDSQAPASNVNDGDMNTEAIIKESDCYWEVDLGDTYALYGVRAVSATGIGNRLTNTVCRLFDENHDSLYETMVTGDEPVFETNLNGPRFARYVRIGLEDKRYSSLDGRREWMIGFKEVEVFGRPVGEVGIQSFNVSDPSVSAGQNVTLDWSVEDVMHAEIFPGIGSVGAHTDANGVGSIVQNMTESTEFILVATNNAGVFTSAVGVEVDGVDLPVVISEVVTENKYSLEDGYGDAPDWIELRNTGNSAVDLTGWGLSDNPSKPMKFVFPETLLEPHETLIVFASGKEIVVDPAGMLHAGFSVKNGVEPVVLTAADGSTVIDRVDPPALDTDLSYGRALDGAWSIMEPTPDAVNMGATYEGWLNTLNWSHARGFYETNFTLTVTSEDPEVNILYSLDGSEPSIPYTTGLPITGTSVVRIQAVWPGYKSARIQTKTFLFLDDVLADPNMSTTITQDATYGPRVKPGLLALPTLSLVVSATGEAIDAIEYDEVPCSLEILWPDGQNPIQEDCGISQFGGSWTPFVKKGLSLSFRQKYGNGKLSAPLFDGFDRGVLARKSFDKLHLRGGNHDMRDRGFFMSDRFIQDSYLDMGSLNPHGRYVHVYLNGEYWGNYNCKEVLNEALLSDYLGGESEDYVGVKGNANQGSDFPLGVGDPPNPEPWERVLEHRGSFEAVSPYLDVSHYIDFMLLWGYGKSESEFRACGPKEAGSGYKFWINDPDGFLRDPSIDRITTKRGPGSIWTALLGENHPDFKMLLADRIYKHFFNDGAMTPAACDARLTARMDEIRDSYLAESARWDYLTPDEWETKAADIRSDMFPSRGDELVAQWRAAGYLPSFDPPTFNQYGGAVLAGFQPVLTSSAGTIYYTLDGTDPRLAGGGISPAASVWGPGAVSVTEDVTITTRVRTSSGDWSALADPRFLLGSRTSPMAGELVISEIHYNPDGPDDYEFIEIWNRGSNLLDLSGVTISNAVRTIFPENTTLYPGAHLVVVEDAVAFSNRYQDAASPWYRDGIDVAGEWVGGLSDGGERIDIMSASNTLISSVRYRSDGDWPERPDGGGSSLELSSPTSVPADLEDQVAYFDDGRSWTASSLYHGSPGRFDAGSVDVVINEVLAHTDVGVDWIEFYNSGTASADLSNMAITDTLDLPARYLIPNGTSIDGQDYLTVSAADLKFGFSELGSDAYLLELSGTNIIRIVDSVSFPAVEREEPFGRYLRSDGVVDFTELIAITPGAPNALPRVGPVVISEIMFVPEPGRSEYVEIMNISDASVPLYDPAIPANTWAFSGAGDFTFPEGTVLEPSEIALLCATNPAAFRSQYGVDESVQVFGPWTGGLAAEGEKLQLLTPGDPEADGFVPMYRADRVSYRTNSYWAVADIGGTSLERRPLSGYGNDPVSWRASFAGGSPGEVMGETFPVGTMISLSGQSPRIAFSAIVGESYEVHYTDSLTDPDWTLLESIPNATTHWIEVTDPLPSTTNRYYRILWNW